MFHRIKDKVRDKERDRVQLSYKKQPILFKLQANFLHTISIQFNIFWQVSTKTPHTLFLEPILRGGTRLIPPQS